MKAKDLQLPRPGMLAAVPKDPAKFRKLCKSVSKQVEENQIVRDWLIEHGMADQIAWVLYPPRFSGSPE